MDIPCRNALIVKPPFIIKHICTNKECQYRIDTSILIWCGKQDLNLHEANAHKNLNLARLPIPPFPHL